MRSTGQPHVGLLGKSWRLEEPTRTEEKKKKIQIKDLQDVEATSEEEFKAVTGGGMLVSNEATVGTMTPTVGEKWFPPHNASLSSGEIETDLLPGKESINQTKL